MHLATGYIHPYQGYGAYSQCCIFVYLPARLRGAQSPRGRPPVVYSDRLFLKQVNTSIGAVV